jgi:hypothetical protein
MNYAEPGFLGSDLQGFLFWASDYDKIADALQKKNPAYVGHTNFLSMTHAEAVRIVSTVLAAYSILLSEGKGSYYRIGEDENIAKTVAASTGFALLEVRVILEYTEALARDGIVKSTLWKPDTPLPEPGPGVIDKGVEVFQKTYGVLFTKLLVAGSIFGLAYLLGKEWLFGRKR